MNDNRNSNQAFMNGLILGGIIGAAIGFLYAPQPGSETRKKLRQSAENFKEKTEPLVEEFETKILPILREIQTASTPVRQEFMEKIERLVDEAEEKLIKDKRTPGKFFANMK